MADLEKQICRLCHNVITNNNFTVIEDFTKDMFNLLLLKHDCDDTTSVTCGICSEKLFAAFEFKTACLHTENTIRTYVYCQEEGTPFDITDIYMKEMENKQLAVLDDLKICRLCMELVDGEFRSLQETDPLALQSYIPEINLDFTRDPVVCEACFDALEQHVSFIKECVNAQGKVIETNGSNKTIFCIRNENKIELKPETSIKSEDVLIKSEDYEQDRTLKNLELGLLKNPDPSGLLNLPYKCTECDYQTKHKHYLARHQLRHRASSEVMMFKCVECDFQTKYRHHLTRHGRTHRDPSEIKMHKCVECDFETKHRRSLQRHMLKHEAKAPNQSTTAPDVNMKTEQIVIKSEKRESGRTLERLETRHQNNPDLEPQTYGCTECEYHTKRKDSLASHQLKHKDVSEVQMYKCDDCKFQTKYSRSLSLHKRRHEDITDAEMYPCDMCQYQSRFKENLASHKLRQHITYQNLSEVKIYKCDECDYHTTYRCNLTSHQLRHKDVSEVKMYKCDECDYQTKYKHHLATHYLKHQDASEVNMYKCTECAFETKRKKNLINHQLTHKDVSEIKIYKCHECDYQTKYKYHLATHCVKHRDVSEVKIYKCNECDYETKYKCNLTNHSLKHRDVSEIKMHKCKYCDFQAKRKKNLANHQLRHKNVSEVEVIKYECDK